MLQDYTGEAVMQQNAVTYSSSDARGYTGTEDCLYVNVYRPYTPDTKLPVLVFLHGGGNAFSVTASARIRRQILHCGDGGVFDFGRLECGGCTVVEINHWEQYTPCFNKI